MNQIKYGVVLSYISLAINNIITILYTPILLRYLGQSEYGLYSLVTSIIAYLTVLDLGLGNTIVRYSALYKSRGEENKLYSLFGLFIKAYFLISLLLLFLGVLIYCNLDEILVGSFTIEELQRTKIMFILLIINLFFTFPLSVFSSIVTAYQKFIFSRLLNILRIILQPILMIPLLLFGYKAIALVVIVSLLNMTTLLGNMIYAFKNLKIKINFNKVDKNIVREIFIFAFFVFLGVAVDKINWSTGQIILGIYCGPETVAIYAVAIQILLCFFGFASSMSGVFLPKITEIINHVNYRKELSDLFLKIGRLQYILLLLVLLGFIFYGKFFISYWAGIEYIDAYYISIIIMIPLMFTSIQHTGVLILQALNMQRFRSIVYFVIAVVNILLSCLLVQKYDALGCSISFASCLILGNIFIMNYYFYKVVKIDIAGFWKDILKSLPLLVIMIFLGNIIKSLFPITSIMILCIHILLFVIIYSIISYIVYMNVYEKGLIKIMLKKFLK